MILRPFVPALVPPKIPDGEKVDFDVSKFFILYFYYFNFYVIHFIIYFIFYFFILYFILLLFFSGVLYTPYYTINLSIYMST